MALLPLEKTYVFFFTSSTVGIIPGREAGHFETSKTPAFPNSDGKNMEKQHGNWALWTNLYGTNLLEQSVHLFGISEDSFPR